MKTSLSHLPAHKRDELKSIVETIRCKAKAVAMIILFGSYTRRDWVEYDNSCDGRMFPCRSDVDLLIITHSDYYADQLEKNTALLRAKSCH